MRVMYLAGLKRVMWVIYLVWKFKGIVEHVEDTTRERGKLLVSCAALAGVNICSRENCSMNAFMHLQPVE